MIAKIISSATKIRLGRRTVGVGLSAFMAAAFFVVAYFAYRYAVLAPSDGAAGQIPLVFLLLLVGLFLAATLTLGLAGMALARQGFVKPLRDLRTCLVVALRDPVSASKLALPDKEEGELGEVIGAANDLFAQITASHWDAFHSMRTMASHTSDAVIAYDEAGKLLYANRACVSLCGFKTFDDIQESAAIPRFEMTPGTPPVALPDCLAHGSFSKEVILIGNEEKRTTVLLNAARLPVSAQFPTRYYASITDISVLRDAQEKLEAQNLELSTANRAKSEFLATMSHEFRTPLNAILGFSEILRSQLFGPLGAKHYEEYAADIHASGTHMLALINDILDISAIEAGKRPLTMEAIDLESVFRESLKNFKLQADAKDIRLSLDIATGLPNVLADKRSLFQMVQNLLSNAVKFTGPDGDIVLSARSADGQLTVQVSDSGIGIPSHTLPGITEPFAQSKTDPHITQTGTGLGLSIVKSLIEAHDGTLTIDSLEGTGTTVTLIFPATRLVTTLDG